MRSFLWASLFGGAALILISAALIGWEPARPDTILVGLVAFAAVASLMGLRLNLDYPHSKLGLCNLFTLARLVLVGVLFVSLIEALSPSWWTLIIALLALSFDGVDGWFARRQGLVSQFGADFDMQVDAMFALVLALFAAMNGGAGVAVILLGLPYYLFVLAKIVMPWLINPLPDRFSRKTVCVFQIAALILLQVPFFANGVLDLLVAAVPSALMWSFGRDIVWLRQNN